MPPKKKVLTTSEKRALSPAQTKEVGEVGLYQFSGIIQQAYNSELRWPHAYKTFERMRRTDPEIAMVRTIFAALSRELEIEVELPDDASDDDKVYQDFMYEVLDDIENGLGDFLDGMLSRVPFYGWGFWEVPLCVRDPEWQPPADTEWRSRYDDGLIGVRRFAWRDPSTFAGWDIDQNSGRVKGMIQSKLGLMGSGPGLVTIPMDQALHITFGDPDNPEGLSPLEGMYRLERIKYAYEMIQGIGYEHAAGHAKFKKVAGSKLDDEEKALVRNAARAILTAQEGNYMILPSTIEGDIIDVPFTAGTSLRDVIAYYGILKLQIFNMQWMALSATSGSGSYSAMNDSSTMMLLTFNAMCSGFVDQMDRQIGERLWRLNRWAFPGTTRRPRYRLNPIDKEVSLTDLASFAGSIFDSIGGPTADDIQAIRRRSKILPDAGDDVEKIAEQLAAKNMAQGLTSAQIGLFDADGNPVDDKGPSANGKANGNVNGKKPAPAEQSTAVEDREVLEATTNEAETA